MFQVVPFNKRGRKRVDVIHTQEELQAHHERLKEMYFVGRLSGACGFRAGECTSLQMFTEMVQREVAILSESNGPNGSLFVSLFEREWCFVKPQYTRNWFDSCRTIESSERIRLVESCLERVDPSSDECTKAFFARIFLILGARPTSVYRTHIGFIVVTDQKIEDPMIEVCLSRDKDGLLIRNVSDEHLRVCLVHSWEHSKDQAISHLARELILKYYWEAWNEYLQEIRSRFDGFVFVSDRGVRYSNLGDSREGGLLCFEKLGLVLTFGDIEEGDLLRSDWDVGFYASPELSANTQKFLVQLHEVQKLGYPGLSREYWTLEGIRRQFDVPLMTSSRLFGKKPPTLTLHKALLGIMRSLGLDQVFFGELLITRKEYQRPSVAVT